MLFGLQVWIHKDIMTWFVTTLQDPLAWQSLDIPYILERTGQFQSLTQYSRRDPGWLPEVMFGGRLEALDHVTWSC